MPKPEQMADQQPTIPPEALAELRGYRASVQPGNEVAAQLAALREEVAALREMLAPPSAVILTGAEVRRQFAQLVAEWRKPGGLLDGPFI